MFEVRTGEIVAQLGGELLGDAELVHRAASRRSKRAGADSITFLSNPRYQAQLRGSRAGCVIVAPGAARGRAWRAARRIVTPDPYLYFARLTQWWARAAARAPARRRAPQRGRRARRARRRDGASIGALARDRGAARVIGAGAVIGAHCIVGARRRASARGTRLARARDARRAAAASASAASCTAAW